MSWLDDLLLTGEATLAGRVTTAESEIDALQATDVALSATDVANAATAAAATQVVADDLAALTFTDIGATPASFTGASRKIVAVNTAETALEFNGQEVPNRGGFVNPQVFYGGDYITSVTTTSTGALTLQPAASGHTDNSLSTITIVIPVAAGVTSLTCHADYGQDGDPFADFDAAKGYVVFITRVRPPTLAHVRYLVSGKVVAT